MIPERKSWLDFLEEDDLAFIKRFLLFSGSLKDLATAYDVSYPTVRLRLDRLIAKIKVFDDQEIEDEFERHLRAAFADSKIDAATLKRLMTAYRKEKRAKEVIQSPSPLKARAGAGKAHREAQPRR